MMTERLEQRDLEILRTLARLRYVPSKFLGTAFFAADRRARRRLQRLAERDLIRSHTRKLAASVEYYAYRLSARGVALVREAFPEEPLPDGLDEKLAAGRLTNLEHREALARLYLGVLCEGLGHAASDDDVEHVARVKGRTRAQRARAEQLYWQPDGDVALRYSALGVVKQVVPDATICSRHRTVRVFVELDRSSHNLARVADSLERYRDFIGGGHYAAAYRDGRTPAILFITRSAARRTGLLATAARVLGQSVACVAVTDDEAPRWLIETLLDPALIERAAVEVDASFARVAREACELALRELAPALSAADLGLERGLYNLVRAAVVEAEHQGLAVPSRLIELLTQMHAALRARKVAHAA